MGKRKQPLRRYDGYAEQRGGERASIKGCILTDKDGNLTKFHPLIKVDDAWEDWFIQTQNIQLCKLYVEPYNFKRTGCKFCPFSLDLANQLEVAYRLMPNEAKQGELIWKPVFNEYRRIGYRLKKQEQMKLFQEEL